MHKLVLILLFATSLVACHQADNTYTKVLLSADLIDNPSQLKFDTPAHDFGRIAEGDKPTFDFKFNNISKNPLLITEVHASCGCATPYWPKDIIKPGEASLIRVEYNTAGNPGKFRKSITVTANTVPNITMLTIEGEVIPK